MCSTPSEGVSTRQWLLIVQECSDPLCVLELGITFETLAIRFLGTHDVLFGVLKQLSQVD
eukprot:m.330055 g.330055  ORF g.330055 m.330055 type:complete len:60 (+) comp20456_c0_seq5:118-297(+)